MTRAAARRERQDRFAAELGATARPGASQLWERPELANFCLDPDNTTRYRADQPGRNPMWIYVGKANKVYCRYKPWN